MEMQFFGWKKSEKLNSPTPALNFEFDCLIDKIADVINHMFSND